MSALRRADDRVVAFRSHPPEDQDALLIRPAVLRAAAVRRSAATVWFRR
jgi:hypothetical protein